MVRVFRGRSLRIPLSIIEIQEVTMISGITGGLAASPFIGLMAARAASAAMRGGAPSGAPPALTLRTQEGDTVTITPKATQQATYGRPARGGSLASLGLKSNDEFDVTVSGDLSEQEKADIQATLQRMDGARATMDSGDFGAGMQAMQAAMQGGGTVASVSGPTGPPPGGPPPPRAGSPDSAPGSGSSSTLEEFLQQVLEGLRSGTTAVVQTSLHA
jgi:hypothetical protein